MSRLIVEDLRVSYGGRDAPVVALDGFSLDVAPGSLTVLLGESGCGKSTALNAIAGLVHPEGGRIRLGDKTLLERGAGLAAVELAPNRRDIGMVFQSYALWPHMVALDNVMYPVLRRGAAKAVAQKMSRDVLAMVRCEHLAERYPGELSGGQQQRIALARAMAARPSLLLFDEPLSNLDAGLRRGLRDELGRIHREIGFTGVYVTHDQSEALALGTQLAVMDGGRIVQLGSPADLYERPINEFVAKFFGANILSARLASGQLHSVAGMVSGPFAVPEGPVRFSFMPHAARIQVDPAGALTVVASMYVGSGWEVRLRGSDEEVLVLCPQGSPAPPIGARARLAIEPGSVCVFRAAG